MANNGPFIQNIPCSIGDTIYKISHKNLKINKWFVYGIQILDDKKGWFVIARNNKNKYKFYETKISFDDFGKTVFRTKSDAETALKDFSTPHEYSVIHKCGHSSEVTLYGDPKYRESRIKWLKTQLCPTCKNKESEKQGCTLAKMSYKHYKEKYADCDTKVDSYDSETKTILVYLML